MEQKKFTIGGIDAERFNIVYPVGTATQAYVAEELARAIEAATGKKPLVVSDEYVTVEHEIRFGTTNRTPAPAAEGEEAPAHTIAKDTYRICVVKKNVNIEVGCVFGFEDVLAAFAEMLSAEGDLAWQDGDVFEGKITHLPVIPESYDICILYHNILGYLPWYPTLNRGAMGLDIYKEYMPDVIGMQEVSHFYHKDISETLAEMKKLGYAEVRYPRYGYGNPIYYNTNKLELVESGYKTARPGDKGTTWAVLKIKRSGGKMFAMINSHFAADSNAKNDHELGNRYRADDARAMVSVVEMTKQRYPNIPIFTGGDYNSVVGSEAINAVREGGLVDIREKVADKSLSDFCAYNGYPKYIEEEKRYRFEEFHLRPGANTNIDFATAAGDQSGVTVHDYVILTDRISCTVSDHLPHLFHFSLEAPAEGEAW